MALLFLDGFEQSTPPFSWNDFTAASPFPGKWVSASTTGAATVSADTATYKTVQLAGSSKSLRFSTGGGTNTAFAYASIGPRTTVFIGTAIYTNCTDWKISFFPASGWPGSGATNHIRVYSNASGQIIVYNNQTSTTLLTTAINSFMLNTWHYIEIGMVYGVSGSVTVKLDGATIGTASSVNTSGNAGDPNWAYFSLGFPINAGNSSVVYHDDVYLCDDAGATLNTFLGPTRVYTLFPTANGPTNEMTPSGAANNWDCVDEQTADTTTYVSTNLANKVETYELPDFGVLPTTVHAVVVGNKLQKQDVGPRYIRNTLTLGGTTVNGVTATPIYGQYRWTIDLFADKPGGSGWAPTDLNNIKIGVESL